MWREDDGVVCIFKSTSSHSLVSSCIRGGVVGWRTSLVYLRFDGEKLLCFLTTRSQMGLSPLRLPLLLLLPSVGNTKTDDTVDSTNEKTRRSCIHRQSIRSALKSTAHIHSFIYIYICKYKKKRILILNLEKKLSFQWIFLFYMLR